LGFLDIDLDVCEVMRAACDGEVLAIDRAARFLPKPTFAAKISVYERPF
jgi:hypothetical protein